MNMHIHKARRNEEPLGIEPVRVRGNFRYRHRSNDPFIEEQGMGFQLPIREKDPSVD